MLDLDTFIVSKIIADKSGGGTPSVVLQGTLTAGQTSITFSDESILSTSRISVYADVWYITASASTGSATITFPVQSADMPVEIEVK